jgi:RNA polymerase sigma-70 factor (sigma-E family)
MGAAVARRVRGEFEVFLDAVSPSLLRLAWLLTGHAATAEDLVQGALERVYVAWPRLEAAGAPAYARRTLVNLHTDLLRRRRGEVVMETVPDRPSTGWDVGAANRVDLASALATLSPRERQCVVLRHHADLSERDVADLLGISVGTVKSSTSRGLAHLRSLLVREGETHA